MATREGVTGLERLVTAVGSAITAALLVWIGSTLVDMREDMAVVKSQLPEIIQTQKDLRLLSERTALLEQSVYRLDEEVRSLEESLHGGK